MLLLPVALDKCLPPIGTLDVIQLQRWQATQYPSMHRNKKTRHSVASHYSRIDGRRLQ
jgi:hypothetical protein